MLVVSVTVYDPVVVEVNVVEVSVPVVVVDVRVNVPVVVDVCDVVDVVLPVV